MATLVVKLLEGATEITSRNVTITGAMADTELVLTAGERASITDWFNLRLQFVADTDRARVSWAEVEAPVAVTVQSVGTLPTIASTTQLYTDSSFLVRLYDGATLVAEREPTLTGSFVTYEWTLTPAEYANITSWSNLRLTLIANGVRVAVSWAEVSGADAYELQTLTLPTLASGATTTAPSVQGDTATMTVELRQGATVITSRSVALTSGYVSHEMDLTAGEMASITDWTALRVALVADGTRAAVSWVQFATAGVDTITVPLITSGVGVFAPTVALGGFALVCPTIPSDAHTHDPSVTVDAVTLIVPTIGTTEAINAGTVSPLDFTIIGSTIASGETLYAPTVALAGVAIVGSHVPSTSALSAPRLDVGAVILLLPTISSGAVLNAGTVVAIAVGTPTHEALLWSGERIVLSGVTGGVLVSSGIAHEELEYVA